MIGRKESGPTMQGLTACRASKYEVAAEQISYPPITTLTADAQAARYLRRKYGLPEVRARLVADLCGIGGRRHD